MWRHWGCRSLPDPLRTRLDRLLTLSPVRVNNVNTKLNTVQKRIRFPFPGGEARDTSSLFLRYPSPPPPTKESPRSSSVPAGPSSGLVRTCGVSDLWDEVAHLPLPRSTTDQRVWGRSVNDLRVTEASLFRPSRHRPLASGVITGAPDDSKTATKGLTLLPRDSSSPLRESPGTGP